MITYMCVSPAFNMMSIIATTKKGNRNVHECVVDIMALSSTCRGLHSSAILQVLRYSDGEKYGPHYDSADHAGDDTQVGDQRSSLSLQPNKSAASVALAPGYLKSESGNL